MSREETSKPGKYYSIIQGNFRTQVPETHPDAVKREWESTDGRKGVKFERIVNALFGFIQDVSFADTEFGMQIYIKLDENDEGDSPIIALNTKSREAEDFMKKLPNVNLTKEVRLRPYQFEGDKGDDVRGMEVMQQDENGDFKKKITNFFYDSEKKEQLNGFPKPEGDTEMYSKDDWKIYFLQANKWLVNYVKTEIVPKFAALKHLQKQVQNERPEISPDEIPF